MKAVRTMFSGIKPLERLLVPAKEHLKHTKVSHIGFMKASFLGNFFFFVNDAKLIWQRFNWQMGDAHIC